MKSFHRKTVMAGAALALLVAIVASCGGEKTPDVVRSATLSGLQTTPPVRTTAYGRGAIYGYSTTREIGGGIIFSGAPVTGAHIHIAAPGVVGSVVVNLQVAQDGTALIPTGTTLTQAQFAALEAGNLYFDVHTAANPNGELRGQIIQSAESVSASLR